MSRMKNQPLADLELEAHDRAQRLVGRAKALRMEQEDEIKTLNRVGATVLNVSNGSDVFLTSTASCNNS